MAETLLSHSSILLFGRVVEDLQVTEPPAKPGDKGRTDPRHGPFPKSRMGLPGQVEQQLRSDKPCFARIYGFSFEGFYYDLPRPVLFLVHGPGLPASEVKAEINEPHRARATPEPSLGGVGAGNFQFADDIMVWSYDKADYTIRMDVESGMFEQVLLDAVLGGPGSFDARGATARGATVRGATVRGATVRGGGNSD
ncbi:hypothetical protein [Nitratireductor sp. GCM10026969]|uniref:hypothetical protein n=1 Tax=Nitratireductor sp. GCM10026969 TaxID=3252645 RepID=UPI00361DD79A